MKVLRMPGDFDYSDLWRHAESRGGNVLSFVRHERKDARRDNRGTAIENQGVSARPGSCPENPPTSQEDKPISDAEIHSARIQFAQAGPEVRHEGRIAEVRLKTGVGCGEKRLDKINCDAKQFDLKTTTWRGETVSPASPVISPRRRPNGTYKNFPSLWAAVWLVVGLVKSGR